MQQNTPVEQYLVDALKKIKKSKFGLKELLKFAFIMDKVFNLYDRLEPKIVSIWKLFIE